MEKPKLHFNPKIPPIIASLPEYLKNPANYLKVEKSILDTFRSSCNHSEVIEWAKCDKCTDKMVERRLLLRKLGFKNPAQYMAWKKVHQNIIEKYPLVDWNEWKKDSNKIIT